MINYFNFEKRDGKYLLTNDFGKYAFVNEVAAGNERLLSMRYGTAYFRSYE